MTYSSFQLLHPLMLITCFAQLTFTDGIEFLKEATHLVPSLPCYTAYRVLPPLPSSTSQTARRCFPGISFLRRGTGHSSCSLSPMWKMSNAIWEIKLKISGDLELSRPCNPVFWPRQVPSFPPNSVFPLPQWIFWVYQLGISNFRKDSMFHPLNVSFRDTPFPLEIEYWRDGKVLWKHVNVKEMLSVLSDHFNDKFAFLKTLPDRVWGKKWKGRNVFSLAE